MENRNLLRRILRILVGLSLLLTLFFQFIKPSTYYERMDRSLYSFTSYLQHVLFRSPAETVGQAINGFATLQQAQHENRVLRQSLSEVKKIQSLLIEANKEILELKDLLELKQTLTSVNYVSANVIEKDATNYNNSLLINVGTKDGVDLNMAVVTPAGLIGKISQVDEGSSIVKLLTSQEGKNQFSVRIQMDESSSVEGLLESYDVATQQYTVSLLDSTKKIKPGMQVVTSGLGEIIPGGILVGEVVHVDSSPATLSVILKVEPAASFSNINAVFVVSKP